MADGHVVGPFEQLPQQLLVKKEESREKNVMLRQKEETLKVKDTIIEALQHTTHKQQSWNQVQCTAMEKQHNVIKSQQVEIEQLQNLLVETQQVR